MTRVEFFKQLKLELEKNQLKDISEILQDYEEHFNHGLTKGKSESEIVETLGSPTIIAKAYKAEDMISIIKNNDNQFHWGLAMNIILRLIVIAPFNLIALFIPGIIILSLTIAGWSVALALGSVSLTLLLNIPNLFSISSSVWMALATVSSIVSLLGLSLISVLIMLFISKHIALALISYLQWNLKFVMQK